MIAVAEETRPGGRRSERAGSMTRRECRNDAEISKTKPG